MMLAEPGQVVPRWWRAVGPISVAGDIPAGSGDAEGGCPVTGTYAPQTTQSDGSSASMVTTRNRAPAAQPERPAIGSRPSRGPGRTGQRLLRPSRVPASSGGERLAVRDQANLEQQLGQPLDHVRGLMAAGRSTSPFASSSSGVLALTSPASGSMPALRLIVTRVPIGLRRSPAVSTCISVTAGIGPTPMQACG